MEINGEEITFMERKNQQLKDFVIVERKCWKYGKEAS